jgi:hypothetical protein
MYFRAGTRATPDASRNAFVLHWTSVHASFDQPLLPTYSRIGASPLLFSGQNDTVRYEDLLVLLIQTFMQHWVATLAHLQVTYKKNCYCFCCYTSRLLACPSRHEPQRYDESKLFRMRWLVVIAFFARISHTISCYRRWVFIRFKQALNSTSSNLDATWSPCYLPTFVSLWTHLGSIITDSLLFDEPFSCDIDRS